MDDLTGTVVAIMTLGVAAVELLLKFSSRHTWRDTVLQELEIYRQMEESKTLKDERDAMRALKKSITEEIEEGMGLREKPVPFLLRFLANVSMLIASLVIGVIVLLVAAAFGMPWERMVTPIVLIIGAVAGVEATVNIIRFAFRKS